jgi:RNA polymerase sigma-70 factor (ECF subfamily)
MKTDWDLISSYRAGDDEAFREFYERHSRALYFYVFSIVRDREAAEELLQDTFLAVLRHVERLEDRGNLRAYLKKTSKNQALDLLKRNLRAKRVLQALAADPFYRLRQQPDDSVLSLEDEQKLISILRRLSDEQREVIVLKNLVGMTFTEITQKTGSPLGSVASRYRYGMEKLRAMASPAVLGD